MKYPDDFIDKVIYQDCLDVMKYIPDKSIDLVYADPPFNAKNRIGFFHRSYGPRCNDNLSPGEYRRFCRRWFREARRIARRLVITPGVANLSLYPLPLWTIVISKPSSPSFNRFGGFCCWEPLLVYDKPFKRIPRDVIVFDSLNLHRNERSNHPCPDNPHMVNWIIDTWTQVGETVLDPFLGSGTTALSCKQLGRHYIGIEINPVYQCIIDQQLSQSLLYCENPMKF